MMIVTISIIQPTVGVIILIQLQVQLSLIFYLSLFLCLCMFMYAYLSIYLSRGACYYSPCNYALTWTHQIIISIYLSIYVTNYLSINIYLSIYLEVLVTIPHATMPSPGLIRLEYDDEPLLPQVYSFIDRKHIDL